MDDECARQRDLILTPVGEPWSGRARYAAAMYFFFEGLMSAEVLEIYRFCCRLDAENPVDALRAYHTGADWITLLGEMAAARDSLRR